MRPTLSNLRNCKVLSKKRKNWIWDQKYFILVLLGQNLKELWTFFEISTLKSFKKENLVEKQKSLDLGPKVLDLGIFGIEFEKTIVIFKSISKLSEVIF